MKRSINIFGVFGKKKPKAKPISIDELELDAELDEALGQAPKKPKKTGVRALFTVRNGILAACFVTFIVCAVILTNRALDYKRSDALYDALAEEMFGSVKDEPSIISLLAPISPNPTLYDYATVLSLGRSEGDISENTAVVGDIHFTRIRAKLEEIRAVNPDIIGWIKMDNTEINYPLVVGEDNDYYLTHAYNGEYLRSGTIFADYRCSKSSLLHNRNTVLYGHNMATGAMFAVINNYKKHPEIFTSRISIYGFDGIYVYEPVLFLDTQSSFYYFQVGFNSTDEYAEFQKKLLDNAIWKSGYELSTDDRLLTMSTCSGDSVTGRRVLVARLVGVEYKAK